MSKTKLLLLFIAGFIGTFITVYYLAFTLSIHQTVDWSEVLSFSLMCAPFIGLLVIFLYSFVETVVNDAR